ncbi:MAG: VCBS repeat-containing protein [Akkermansiaceae bacterium]|nr:VCBS repeat-containing protein [Akkermansiaceae bacterium]
MSRHGITGSDRITQLKKCGFLLLLAIAGCSEEPIKKKSASEVAKEQLAKMIASEELIQKLTPRLREIGSAMVSGSRENLSQTVASEASLPPWEDLDPGHRWTSASFGTLSGEFSGGGFVMKTKFEGVRRGENGSIAGITAKQKLFWEKNREKPEEWTLVKWEPLEFERDHSPQPLFEEVLDQILPDPLARKKARTAYHEEVLRKNMAGEAAVVGRFKITNAPDTESTFQYPSVSVVDFDSDGHEDFFLTSRWVTPQLFRNKGDGTYVEVTAGAGINPNCYVNTAVFADFDNDGDPDAILGRSFEPAIYYRNDGGKFTDVTASASDLGKLFLVSSMAVSDVNGDGLLDVYLSTYSPVSNIDKLKHQVLSPEQVRRFDQILATSSPFLDERGVPNVLLMNRGNGRLERAGGTSVEIWRKSYQPIWFDADNDGDDDLYVCNDFGPDSYLRNDTPPGAAEPILVDAFAEIFPDGQMAFGMGASCGDFDNDGDLDLFVSNMYSKAGNRIVPFFENADPRILVAARGNFLYENKGGIFHLANENDAPETKTGWAFGGQFADFNNDGWLDLYVPSGLYSAPKEAATEVDL